MGKFIIIGIQTFLIGKLVFPLDTKISSSSLRKTTDHKSWNILKRHWRHQKSFMYYSILKLYRGIQAQIYSPAALSVSLYSLFLFYTKKKELQKERNLHFVVISFHTFFFYIFFASELSLLISILCCWIGSIADNVAP